MVFKQLNHKINLLKEFENDVKEYGIQTHLEHINMLLKFENDVKEYGIQTIILLCGS